MYKIVLHVEFISFESSQSHPLKICITSLQQDKRPMTRVLSIDPIKIEILTEYIYHCINLPLFIRYFLWNFMMKAFFL